MDARHGVLQELSRQAVHFRAYADAFVAVAWAARAAWDLHLAQRGWARYRVRATVAAQLSVTSRFQSLSDLRRRSRRESPDHLIHPRCVARDATPRRPSVKSVVLFTARIFVRATESDRCQLICACSDRARHASPSDQSEEHTSE